MSTFGIGKKIQERNGNNFTLVFCIEFHDFLWKPHLNRIKGVKLHLIKEIQICGQMTIYGQTLGEFKRENSRNREKINLHKNIIEIFWVQDVWSMTCISSRITSFWRHNDIICDKIRVIAPHVPNSKNYNFDFMQLCLSSGANTFIVFALKYP